MVHWQKLAVTSITAVLMVIYLSGCGSEFVRAMDDYNSSMGAQRTCQYEATGGTEYINGDGYNFSFGGLCNYWEGNLENYSKYKIKCTSTDGYGNRLNSVYASPGQNTGTVTIGRMNGSSISVDCMRWSRNSYVDRNTKYFAIEKKMSNGVNYVRLRNTSNVKRKCFIKMQSGSVLTEEIRRPQEATRWTSPDGRVSYNCVYSR